MVVQNQVLGYTPGTGDVESVTGNIVSNVDPANPIVTQVQSDWDATSGLGVILNKPDILLNKLVTANTSDAYTIDPEEGSVFYLTWNDDTTITLGSPTLSADETQTIYIILNPGAGAGDYTLLWVGDIDFVSGEVPLLDQTPGKVTILEATWVGSKWKFSQISTYNEPVFLASATTIDLDKTGSNFISITGTETITTISSISGIPRILRFEEDGCTIVNDPLTLPLPAPGNIVTKSGDIGVFLGFGSNENSSVYCISYSTFDGRTFSGVEEVTGNIVDNTDSRNPVITQVQSDWDASSGLGEILNKPDLGTMATQDADSVSISGGNIDGTLIGAINPTIVRSTFSRQSVSSTVTAAGTNQATATALTSVFNNVNNVASGTGVKLPAALSGIVIEVYNTGANTLSIYSAAAETINGVAGTFPVTLLNSNKGYRFIALSSSEWEYAPIGSMAYQNSNNVNITGGLADSLVIGANNPVIGTFTYMKQVPEQGISAAGTDQSDATALTTATNNVTTVSSGTGVKLPLLSVGAEITVYNNGANPMKVYSNGSETINGVSGATGITMDPGTKFIFNAIASNTWIYNSELSGTGTMALQDADDVDITGGSIGNTVIQDLVVSDTVSAAETYTIDPTIGNVFKLSIEGDCNINIGSLSMGIGQQIRVIFNANGEYAINWGNNIDFLSGCFPILDASGANTEILLTGIAGTWYAVNGDYTLFPKTVASASSINLDQHGGNIINITGTTNIDTIVTKSGNPRILKFSDVLTLVHSSNLLLPGNDDIVTENGDIACFVGSEADSITTCVWYTKTSVPPNAPVYDLGVVYAASTTSLSATYSNGSSGSGATLTATTNTTLTLDGKAITAGMYVLIKNQGTSYENGIYLSTDTGSGSDPWVLTRADYFDSPSEMLEGCKIIVANGDEFSQVAFYLDHDVTTVGTTSVLFNILVSKLVRSGGIDDGSIINDTTIGEFTRANAQFYEPINVQTGTTYTLVSDDASKLITVNSSAPMTLTLPQQSTLTTPEGYFVDVYNLGSGAVNLVKEGSETLVGKSILDTNESARIYRTTTTQWAVSYTGSAFGTYDLGSVKAASTANLSANYSNGSSGAGATLTSTSNGTLTLDGISILSGDYVLIADQVTLAHNGIYLSTTTGDGSTPWVLTRAQYFNSPSKMLAGCKVVVLQGATYAQVELYLAGSVITVGTSAVVFGTFNLISGGVQSVTGSIVDNTDPNDPVIVPFILEPCVAVQQGAPGGSYTYDNGSSGVGATLTNSGTQAALEIDGHTFSEGDRILWNELGTLTRNGVYVVTNPGTPSTNWVLTRSDDYDTPTQVFYNTTIFVKAGNTYAGNWFTMGNNASITIGSSDIPFYLAGESLNIENMAYQNSSSVAISGGSIVNTSYRGPISAKTTSYTTTSNDGTLTNTGATALVAFTLNATPNLGETVSFCVIDDDGLSVTRSGSQTIYLEGVSANSWTSTTIGSTLTLRYVNTDVWMTVATTGVWA